MNLDALSAMFKRERKRFAEVYPHAADAELHLKKFKRHAERDCCMALVGDDEPIIFFHTDMVDRLTKEQCLALIRHELAHVCEPAWSERKVDALAEKISGAFIFYGPDDIQTVKHGHRPRPLWLPK